MKKFLRSKRKENPYEDADQFLKRELCLNNEPDKELSCNGIDISDAKKCLIEYKATNIPKPLTNSIAGFYLPSHLEYELRHEDIGYFSLIKNTHHCLLGSDNLKQIAAIGYNHNDISLTKEEVFTFIDKEERSGNDEWKVFLKENIEWRKKLTAYRDQKRAAALEAWQKFGGGSFKEVSINHLINLDPDQTRFFLTKIIEAEALPSEELDKLKKYI